MTGSIAQAQRDDVPAADGDRQLLAIIGAYRLPQPDPDAILVQHLDPALAVNTVRTTLSLATQVGGRRARELLLRLYLDTTGRGIAMATVAGTYREAGGEDSEAWRSFEGLVAQLGRAIHGRDVRDPTPGRRVMIIDGVYRALHGVVSEHEVPAEERTAADEVLVDVEGGTLTQISASWCYFLA